MEAGIMTLWFVVAAITSGFFHLRWTQARRQYLQLQAT